MPPDRRRLRLGATAIGSAGWAAAGNYLRNVTSAADAHVSDELDVVPVTDGSGRVVRAAARLSGVDLRRTWLARSHGLDAMLVRVPTARLLGAGLLGWIPDLQHVVLPEMFDERTRAIRDRGFRLAARVADRLLLPSEQAREEFAQFAPEAADRLVALHPVAALDDATFDVDPRSVSEQYELPDRFLYCPGQLWRHKDHATLFRATALARVRGAAVVVVTSGRAEDYRHPSHPERLQGLVAELGVGDALRHLGSIPYADVLQLMRTSVAVVNPSRYEGFGMTVDEARTVGARLILSDLPVHHEHGTDAVFFPPGNVDALADLLVHADQRWEPGPHPDRARAGRQETTRRQQQYASRLVKIVRQAAP